MPAQETMGASGSVPATGSGSSVRLRLLKIFVIAFVIRWVYAAVIFAAMGPDGLLGVDSHDYVHRGAALAAMLQEGSLHGWQWLGTDTIMMPLFHWLLALTALVAGKHLAICYVLAQGVIDAGTCLLVFGIATTINRDYAIPAAIAAAINPTQIVLSGLVYTDTPFLFCVALFLWSAANWLSNPSWRWSVTMALALSAAALIRVLIVPFVPVLLIFLAIVMLIRRGASMSRFAQLALVAVVFSSCLAPVSLRNANLHGFWALTAQSGMHMSRWVVPLVREAKDGTPWKDTYLEMEKRRDDRYGPDSGNPFLESQRYVTLATEELRNLGPMAIVKAWTIGAVLNLGTPALILSPPLAALPRQSFYATTGSTITEKIWSFLVRSDHTVYALALFCGLAGLGAIRLLQLYGAIKIAANTPNIPALLLFVGWIGYILLINGPVASPKYRLPMEPLFNLMTGAGWAALTRRPRRPEAT
jgi:4-amino-4-deoxy-L-arabinose transferase-like glycosyltransferase